MKKIIMIIGLMLITLPMFGQVFETTLTQVDLYGGNFDTFISTSSINHSFTMDNEHNTVTISTATVDLFRFDIIEQKVFNFEGNKFLSVDIINVNNKIEGNMIIIDKPLKSNTMQLLFNFQDNSSLIFNTNFELD